jgi:hypothetical protein
MRNLHTWEDKKASVVGDQVQVFLSVLIIPSDPPVSILNLPGRRSEEKAGQIPSLSILDKIPQVLADGLGETQVMMSGKIRAKTKLIIGACTAENDL